MTPPPAAGLTDARHLHVADDVGVDVPAEVHADVDVENGDVAHRVLVGRAPAWAWTLKSSPV